MKPPRRAVVSAAEAALLACRLLVEVYKRAQKRGGRINRGDIEAAYAAARAAINLADLRH
jgi:hypothetical protein